MSWSADEIKAAWMHLRNNRDEVLSSENCVCIHCGSNFSSKDVVEWLNPIDGGHRSETRPSCVESEAICPRCGMDYVLGDSSGLPVRDPNFRLAMRGGVE